MDKIKKFKDLNQNEFNQSLNDLLESPELYNDHQLMHYIRLEPEVFQFYYLTQKCWRCHEVVILESPCRKRGNIAGSKILKGMCPSCKAIISTHKLPESFPFPDEDTEPEDVKDYNNNLKTGGNNE